MVASFLAILSQTPLDVACCPLSHSSQASREAKALISRSSLVLTTTPVPRPIASPSGVAGGLSTKEVSARVCRDSDCRPRDRRHLVHPGRPHSPAPESRTLSDAVVLDRCCCLDFQQPSGALLPSSR